MSTGVATIYALCDPHTEEVRYIGQTVRSLRQRLSGHLCEAWQRPGTYRARWINSLGAPPVIVALVETQEQFSSEVEIDCIATYRELGYRLVNGTDGGEGWRHTADTRAKIAASNRRRIVSDETRAKMSSARKGVSRGPHSEEHRSRIASALSNRFFSPEHRARISAARSGVKPSDDARRKMSAARTGLRHTPEARAKIRESNLRRHAARRALAANL